METIKDWAVKIWIGGSTLLLTILYFLYVKRGRSIAQLKNEAARTSLANELRSIKEQSEQTEKDYEKALERYQRLRRLYGEPGGSLGPHSIIKPRD